MTADRKIAIVAGLLFIAATASSLAGAMVILDPILKAPDYLTQLAENRNLAVTGVLLEFINNFAIVAISIVLYPVLQRYSVALAVGYVASRVMESLLITLGDIAALALTTLANAPPADAALTAAMGGVLLAISGWIFLIGPGLVLAITALILNFILYRARLVPRWLSLWGLVGAALLFLGDLLAFYGIGQLLLFAAPFALQEMVFALWLIVKGFNIIHPQPRG